MKRPAVYIMASGRNGTLYTGVTSQSIQRTCQHREGVGDERGRGRRSLKL